MVVLATGEQGAAAGLTTAAAAERRARDGPNVVPEARGRPLVFAVLAQFVHFFAILLWVAGGLAIIAGLPQLGIAVFVVILVNGVFAFVQEYRAEQAAAKLRDLVPRRVMVRRDGAWTRLDARELVRGDLVRLEAGDHVPADLALVEGRALEVDISMMTGESVPATPETGDALYAGTFVVSGQGVATVVATGRATRLAGLVGLTAGAGHRPTPLALELKRLVRTIAMVALGIGFSFFGLALLLGSSPSDGFLFAIGVTVALVPEGLLPTVTLSLALGAQRMAARGALVRHLEAVETLGATTFICTDKTGTLTANQMQVVEAWTPAGPTHISGNGYAPEGTVEGSAPAVDRLRELAVAAAVCSGGAVTAEGKEWQPDGDPMEAAIYVLARRTGADDIDALRSQILQAFPFDTRRRRMSVVLPEAVVVKGAPEAILPLCTNGPASTATAPIDEMAARGLRVIAVARRAAAGAPLQSADDAERNLELVGLLGLEDPPRPEVPGAVAACRAAGIRLAMVTGDHPLTAAAIAREVGLWTDGSGTVIGDELPEDEQALGALIDRDGIVLARVTPEQKLRVARALKARGHVLAMTGDGVNDGPALEEADVGVAMGARGADVARAAADLVLLDDNFATIVAAVEEGRATFGNIRRFLTYHLTDNVAELTPFLVWALSGGSVPLALGVLQILCLDIGTDVLPALALGAERPRGQELKRTLAGRHLVDRSILVRVFGVLGPVEALVEMLAFIATFWVLGWRPGDAFPEGDTLLRASGAAFTAVVLGQLANAFACRSATVPPWKLGWTSNRLLLGAVAAEVVLLGVFILVPPIADLLEHAVPEPVPFAIALLAIPAVLAADAVHKAWLRSRTVSSAATP